jgi:hypothetical protein
MPFILLFSCTNTAVFELRNIKTRSIINKESLHLSDTLYVVQPFTRVYLSAASDNLETRNSWEFNQYISFGNFFAPISGFYVGFPSGEIELREFIKSNVEKKFTRLGECVA